MSDERQRDSRPTLFPKAVTGETTINMKLGVILGLLLTAGGVVFGAGVVRGDIGHLGERQAVMEADIESNASAIETINQRLAGDAEWRRGVERKIDDIGRALSKNTEQLSDIAAELRVIIERARLRPRRD